jgi:hypothetical protein
VTTEKPIHHMTDTDFEQIRRETLARDAIEPRAHAVHYDPKFDTVVIELKNGVMLIVPTRLVQGLRGADPRLLAQVEKDGRGYGLNWEELGVTISVPGLLAGIYGNAQWMEELHKYGGTGAGKRSATHVNDQLRKKVLPPKVARVTK